VDNRPVPVTFQRQLELSTWPEGASILRFAKPNLNVAED